MRDFSSQINLEYSINSGQVFLWKKHENVWYGINGQDVLAVNQNPFQIRHYAKKSIDFFRNDDNIKEINNALSKDKIVRSAIKDFTGLRLLRQDPFQCYISFIVSSNSSIQNIKQRLDRLCKKFGTRIKFDKKEFFVFPKPQTLANASIVDLKKCGLGYRAKSVKNASRDVISGKIDFDELIELDYNHAKEKLLKVYGIGDKVADCILLFSLEKLEAFPLDRWMLRILQNYYSNQIQLPKTITKKRYEILHQEIVKYFGTYAGYAQQFLFKMERDLNQKKWL